MNETLTLADMTAEQDQRIRQTLEREESRLRAFIRRRVADAGDADDIFQDVFSELIEALRLMTPIEQVGAWLYRVARNRITDLFRRRGPRKEREIPFESEGLSLAELLPSLAGGPEMDLARAVALEEIEAALDELPDEQRNVFLAHEIEGRSFKELAEESGLSINTLLSRKHYAVLHLRRRLRDVYDEIKD